MKEKFMFANFNKEGFVRNVREKWCKPKNYNVKEVLYSQITLDYFWIPPGWAEQHWTDKVRRRRGARSIFVMSNASYQCRGIQ